MCVCVCVCVLCVCVCVCVCVCHLHYTRILCTQTIFKRDFSDHENRIIVPSNAANWPIFVMDIWRLSLEIIVLFSIPN